MKITKLETFHIQPRWMFLKISTDEGLVGWGEPALEGKNTIVAEAVRVLGQYIIGKDPDNIEALWQLMYRGGFYRGGAILCSAISGIEQALWDIKGKKLGVPVWNLLGGKCRDKIRMYTHMSYRDDADLSDFLTDVREKVDEGYTALKTTLDFPYRPVESIKTINKFVNKIAAVRDLVGEDIDLAVDFHGRATPAMAKILAKELEPFHLMFIEEPVLPENVDMMKEVGRATTIPIATGERLFTTFGFREIIEKRVASIIQPDLCHCGGIMQGFKIAAMAANNYAVLAPHNPLGPINLACCLQLNTCVDNFLAQEVVSVASKHTYGQDIFKEAFTMKDSYVEVPNKPGLGFEVDEEAIKELMYDGNWINPVDKHGFDGSLAEW
ncbi:MAG: galactonate dehydratase [Candidatus Epulonipiscioides saccharophilum]|nr:MAG: galactonate dehydratase [Epulopiscium sp. AS2M-Bin001]